MRTYSRYRAAVRRAIELTRFLVAIPAIGSIIGSMVLMVIGAIDVVSSIVSLVDSQSPTKDAIINILTAVDTLLLATVLLVIGYGLYELFVDPKITLPPWLEIRSLDDLKSKLIGVVVAIIAVFFLGVLVEGRPAEDVLLVGAGAAALVIALAAFTWATRKDVGKRPERTTDPGAGPD